MDVTWNADRTQVTVRLAADRPGVWHFGDGAKAIGWGEGGMHMTHTYQSPARFEPIFVADPVFAT